MRRWWKCRRNVRDGAHSSPTFSCVALKPRPDEALGESNECLRVNELFSGSLRSSPTAFFLAFLATFEVLWVRWSFAHPQQTLPSWMTSSSALTTLRYTLPIFFSTYSRPLWSWVCCFSSFSTRRTLTWGGKLSMDCT